MIIPINSFNQVQLVPNSLIVFDIDETIISFEDIDEGWWKRTFDKYYTRTNDYDLADELSLNEWISHISNSKPQLLDEINFIKLITQAKELKCEMIMLTARRKFLFDITLSHITQCNIDIDSDSIYFNKNKGKELYDIVTNKYQSFENIIFIDDVESNLEDVANTFNNLEQYSLQLYKINHYENDSDETIIG